ncbi:MAG: glucoamylase family protein, partial [Gemmatimonadota bacterium]
MVSVDEPVRPPPTSPLEELAQELAQSHTAIRRGRAGGVRRSLAELRRTLGSVYSTLEAGIPEGAVASYAAEWLLDNRHVVRETLVQIEENLPRAYERELPQLAGGVDEGRLRVLALAREALQRLDGQPDVDRLKRFLRAYQQVAPLSMGELWALPLGLRLATLQDLASAASATLEGGEPAESVRIPTCILGLRSLAAQDWRPFFEGVSRVDEILSRDAADVYRRMEFASRDDYRKAVERIARDAGRGGGAGEEEVAQAALELSRVALAGDGGPGAERRVHVGFYLVAEGRDELERHLQARLPAPARLRRWAQRHGVALYLTAVATIATALVCVAAALTSGDATPLQAAVLLVLVVVPALTVSVSLVNWATMQLIEPRPLPKLDFERGVPASCRTLVVVPCMLTSEEDVATQLHELEVNFLGNADPNVAFALLSDLADAGAQQLPEDEHLVERARAGIRALNERYGESFLLLHRERGWNAGEGRWIGWERKRGKLEELNRLLLGEGETSFTVREGPVPRPKVVRYVITADADTFLPPGAAVRLVATVVHPLNRPQVEPDGAVRTGYTVVQPRIEVAPEARRGTLFSEVFEADRGLDLYTHAVSDVYQELAGEGNYAGKGIYEVGAFQRALEDRVPENALLSHDLFEGVHGRAGLATDITVFEHYPAHVLTYMRRLHRWVRGDWQLLPWLAAHVPARGGGKVRTRLSALDRWKIFDNLRRSLLAPTLLALVVAGWVWLPGRAWVWTLGVLAVLGTPVLLQGAATLNRVARATRTRPETQLHGWRSLRPAARKAFASLWTDVVRWLLAASFLAYEAVVVTDAVLRTLWRMWVSRRRLLEWTTAAHSARALESRSDLPLVWRQMAAAPAIGVIATVLVASFNPAGLPAALPLALLWVASPQVAHLLSRQRPARFERLSHAGRQQARLLARRTWLFFQHFVGPGDHWLPPDNFQEDPGGILARRTSPTNVGMSLLSNLAAFDLGYIGPLTLSASLRNTLEALERLERYRGHFLNWYDTRTLEPLNPRYVSTVDSGNLAACLIALSQGCARLRSAPLLRVENAEGFLDTPWQIPDVLQGVDVPELQAAVRDVRSRARAIRERVVRGATGPRAWFALLGELEKEALPQLEERVVTLAEAGARQLDPATVGELSIWIQALRTDVRFMRREVDALAPWIPLFARPPAAIRRLRAEQSVAAEDPHPVLRAWTRLRQAIPRHVRLEHVPRACEQALRRVERFVAELHSGAALPVAERDEALAWASELAAALPRARTEAERVLSELAETAARFEELAGEMQFGFLYDARRHLFHIGFNVSAGEPDANYYDLLASEARLASFVAIAKGDVPPEHWLHLGRPFARVNGQRTLLSWGGTMFEYLMPPLLMRVPPDSLLAESCRSAIALQSAHGADGSSAWGVSESGYHQLDPQGNYQYRAFGVPGLGLKRGLGDREVVAPYASLLALPFAPAAVIDNLARLREQGMLGRYGLFEALDFGVRGAEDEKGRIVRSYMAHHQGMILVALDNVLSGFPMVERFHAHPRIESVEYLLHEQVAWHAPLLEPVAVEAPAAAPRRRSEELRGWHADPRAPVPQVHVLSNGRMAVLLTASGAGGTSWKGRSLTRRRSDPTCEATGTWVYVQDLDDGWYGSATQGPMNVPAEDEEAWFTPYAAEFHRREHELALRLAVTVPAEDDVAVRYVRVMNETDRRRRLALVSYAEVALAPHEADRRHPAFSRLFVESEAVPELNALLFRRRPRSADEEPLWMAHALVLPEGRRAEVSWETDRAGFVGRWGSTRRPA